MSAIGQIDRQTFRLANIDVRRRVWETIKAAPDFSVVTVGPPKRSLPQNAFLHAALTDIAEQVEWKGQRFTVDVWKRLCTASWLREEGEQPELIPALDGKGFDIIFEHTSSMTVAQLSSLIEWCLCFGAQNGVTFKEPRP